MAALQRCAPRKFPKLNRMMIKQKKPQQTAEEQMNIMQQWTKAMQLVEAQKARLR